MTTTSNTIKVNDVEIYLHDIQYYADEYINTLDDKQLELLYGQNKNMFVGMLKYIYNNYIKHNKLNYNNIRLLDGIWDIYTDLCYKYNKRPTILNYCVLTGINQDTIWDWKRGEYRTSVYFDKDGNEIEQFNFWKMTHPGEPYRQEPSTLYRDTVKKWFTVCEAALYDGATEQNSIGCIFALKANYGYTETAPVPTINQNQRILSSSELPQLSDNSKQFMIDMEDAEDHED